MPVLDDKEEIRLVYGFKQDVSFDIFHRGLVYLANGDFIEAVRELSKLADDTILREPAVYKYFIVAMIENGSAPEDMIGYTKMWIASAQAFGNDRELKDATFTHDLYEKRANEAKLNENKT
jgi:hypothetical protein